MHSGYEYNILQSRQRCLLLQGLNEVTPAFYCQLTSLLMPLAQGKIVVALEVSVAALYLA